MFLKLLKRFFENKNERNLRKLYPIIDSIKLYNKKMEKMSNYQFKKQTLEYKSRFNNGEKLEELLPEAFALVKEGAYRCLGIKHYDVQLLGGIVLHNGKIAEMKTGEGKTLVATLPAYLNAITGHGVHIVTVNEYLADRDSKWMGSLYNLLGISVGVLKQGMDDKDKKKSYNSDVVYGTNNEFGFDYLRDNMKFSIDSMVQRKLNYSIVDEVDSILIDEARTPLIISGASEVSNKMYKKINNLIYKLNSKSDYKIDEKTKSVVLTESGIFKVEKILSIKNIYDQNHIETLHHINQALRAHTLFKKDIDYIVKNGQVVIVDEFTGRLMPGRRYSEGLHQALEAKESVKIKNENQTLATITFQNYFRMYNKLAGMTGTAATEELEFKKIYNLNVVVIPTNKIMVRSDFPDMIYKTFKEKFKAVVKDINKFYKKGQPILVGTASINNSEMLSKELRLKKIKHSVLNAKNHEKEAEIIALAGQKKSVTISTNMAGRGTDIVLGNDVGYLGGLHVIGTERHESRRIDNQLRGRSGRQGDPGSSRFYLALDDSLLRIFGGSKIKSLMNRLGIDDNIPIEHKLISRSIENAQSKVESRNFDIRKHLLEYDDVLNQQRKIIYKQRYSILNGENLKEVIEEIISEKVNIIVENTKDWNSLDKNSQNKTIYNLIFYHFNFELTNQKIKNNNFSKFSNIFDSIYKLVCDHYYNKESIIGYNNLRQIERVVMLNLVDTFWKDHLINMEHLKEGIGLRSYAQQNPLIVYKKEGFEMFQNMILNIRYETVKVLLKLDVNILDKFYNVVIKNKEKNSIFLNKNLEEKNIKEKKKIGRNSLCPCKSGLKHKKCCGS